VAFGVYERLLQARSWLSVGRPVNLDEAEAGFGVIVLKRGEGQQPGPDVLNVPGHVGLFAGREGDVVLLLAGNQSDAVSVQRFPASQILGIRRIM
jgi:hypothetical protein